MVKKTNGPKKRKVPVIVTGSGGAEYTKGKRKFTRPEENQVHRPIVRILEKIENYTGLLTFFHVPNQLLRRTDLKKIFHGLGVRAGVPDLCIVLKDGVTIWLELKFGGNGASDKQEEFQGKLTALGHKVETIDAKDSQDAQEQLFALLARYGVADFRYVHPTDR